MAEKLIGVDPGWLAKVGDGDPVAGAKNVRRRWEVIRREGTTMADEAVDRREQILSDALDLLHQIYLTPCECPIGGRGRDIPKAVGDFFAKYPEADRG